MEPTQRLVTDVDLRVWETCEAHSNLIDFVKSLAESVRGQTMADCEENTTQEVKALLGLLDHVRANAALHPAPPSGTKSRFGKVEFREFYDDMASHASSWLTESFPALQGSQVEQLVVYFRESWGDRTRIDYGSGHELNFLCFLYGLLHYGCIRKVSKDLVLRVFSQYLELMRTLELNYWLEPAGSHGVWGLDDYHFLPFLFGAYQLSYHKHLKPKSIRDPEVVEMFADKYMYIGCIDFINKVKTTASLRWHSPMLDDISAVKSWAKVAEGMLKMYKAEVLGKLPIMQHFYFSEFLPCPPNVTSLAQHDSVEYSEGHQHVHSWGDCCGIKLPSVIAASHLDNSVRKTIPFD